MQNLEKFMSHYSENLKKAVLKYPSEYSWPIENVPVVTERMKAAIQKGSFNKDGYAIKWTCKELSIPYTYEGIKTFINGGTL